jgi:hypothetical protein
MIGCLAHALDDSPLLLTPLMLLLLLLPVLLPLLLLACSIPCKAGLTTPEEASTSITACRLATRGYYLTYTATGGAQANNKTAPQRSGTPQSAAAPDGTAIAANGLQNLRDPLFAAVAATLCSPNTYQDGESMQQQCTACPHGLRTQQVSLPIGPTQAVP